MPATTTPILLRDGSRLELASMLPSHADALLRFHHRLSSEATYQRYFSFHPELSERELHRLTNVDHRDREAVVAVDGSEIVAVARFDRTDISTDAEIAFLVTDDWRGRGLGPVLFAELVARARVVGITRFTAQALTTNNRMLALFAHCGLPSVTTTSAGVADVTIDLA